MHSSASRINEFAGLLALVLLAGCTPGPLDDQAWPATRPLGRDFDVTRPSPDPDDAPPDGRGLEEPVGALTLADAIDAALRGSPGLLAAGYEVRAREAEAIRAGRAPNPELSLAFENFGGSGTLAEDDALETTLALSQVVELGGKRATRRRLAEAEAQRAGWVYEFRRMDVLTKAAVDFVELLADEAKLALDAEIESIADDLLDDLAEPEAERRVDAVDRARLEAEVAWVLVERGRTERAVEMARLRLASNWGSAEPRFERAAGDLMRIGAPPDAATLLAQVEASPELMEWTATAAARRAEVELALAGRTPDLTVSGGVRYLDAVDDVVFVAGIALPLLINDDGRDAVRAARLRERGGGASRDQARIEVRTSAAIALERIDAAITNVERLRDDVLPLASTAFDRVRAAYPAEVGGLDVLDAARRYVDARRELIDACREYHLAVISAERLLGMPLQNAGSD